MQRQRRRSVQVSVPYQSKLKQNLRILMRNALTETPERNLIEESFE
jgi:hypothetical protein